LEKYDYEFKKKVVEAYFQGEGGYRHLALQFGISGHELLGDGLNRRLHQDLISYKTGKTCRLHYSIHTRCHKLII